MLKWLFCVKHIMLSIIFLYNFIVDLKIHLKPCFTWFLAGESRLVEAGIDGVIKA